MVFCSRNRIDIIEVWFVGDFRFAMRVYDQERNQHVRRNNHRMNLNLSSG